MIMLPVFTRRLTGPICAVPTTPSLQAGDVVLRDVQAGPIRITGRTYRRNKDPKTGAWSLELLGYVGESIDLAAEPLDAPRGTG
jgi:hypothetical protein